MASVFETLQFFSFLFKANGIVHVVAEGIPPGRALYLKNSEEGISEIEANLGALVDRQKEPLFCIGIAPGAELEGVLAEQLLDAPVRRWLMARPLYELFAKEQNLDPQDSQTLLLACRRYFPGESAN